MLLGLPVVDSILEQYAHCVGGDLPGYRNHVYRLINLMDSIEPIHPDHHLEVGVAAAFHDMGIWTASTWDYIQPSLDAAAQWLHEGDLGSISQVVRDMIENHHKILPCPAGTNPLVETFRRADWCDVTLGFRASGVTRAHYARLLSLFPAEGFHRRLLVLAAGHARRRPFRPLPMLRL